MFKKVSISKGYRLINSGPVVLITSSYKNKKNVMTLNWMTVINSEPFIVGIAVSEDSFTSKLISKSKEFGINIPDKRILNKVKICGSYTGDEVDKFKKAAFKILEAKRIKVPLIGDCVALLECKVLKRLKFEDVDFFIAEVVYCRVKEGLFKDIWNTKKVKLIHHLGGGNFYFS